MEVVVFFGTENSTKRSSVIFDLEDLFPKNLKMGSRKISEE